MESYVPIIHVFLFNTTQSTFIIQVKLLYNDVIYLNISTCHNCYNDMLLYRSYISTIKKDFKKENLTLYYKILLYKKDCYQEI